MKTFIIAITTVLIFSICYGTELARFDKNNDGKLSRNEIIEGLKSLQNEPVDIKTVEMLNRMAKAMNIQVESPVQTETTIKKATISTTENKGAIDFAVSIAEKFLNYVERKNIRSAAKMSYKLNERNSNGGQSYRYKVPELFIKHEIEKYKRYGSLKNRELVSSSVGKSAPSMPDSQYVSLRYKLEFTNKDEEFITIVIKTEGEQSGTVIAYPFGSIYADK